jgi:hypothetical protein
MSGNNKKRKASAVTATSSYEKGTFPPTDNRSSAIPSANTSSKRHPKKKSTTSSDTKVVQVFECPSAFPGASTTRSANTNSRSSATTRGIQTADNIIYNRDATAGNNNNNIKKSGSKPVDFYEAAQEIRELGSSTWQGYQRKLHLEEKYTEITGLTKKRQKWPVKILWGMERKQAQRKARAEEEARAAGIVIPKNVVRKSEKERERNQAIRKNRSMFGPTPSVGHMNHGILRVHKKLPPK